MDDTLKVEFPLGDLKIVVSEPTQGQLLAIALLRKAKGGDRQHSIERVVQVLEKLTGAEQWYEVIEEGMLAGDISPEQLMEFAASVFRFDWAAHHKVKQDIVSMVDAIEREETAPVAGPRVVSGG